MRLPERLYARPVLSSAHTQWGVLEIPRHFWIFSYGHHYEKLWASLQYNIYYVELYLAFLFCIIPESVLREKQLLRVHHDVNFF